MVEILKLSNHGLNKKLGELTMTNFKGPKEKNMKNGDDVKVFEGGDLDDENGMFNFDNLRLSQNFSELVGVKKALLTVPVKKPHRQEFIRVRPGSEWRLETAVLELKEEQETYLVDSKLWQNLPGEIIPKVLFTTINRQGTLTIWPVRLPGEDGRHNPWHRSAELTATTDQFLEAYARLCTEHGKVCLELAKLKDRLRQYEDKDSEQLETAEEAISD